MENIKLKEWSIDYFDVSKFNEMRIVTVYVQVKKL